MNYTNEIKTLLAASALILLNIALMPAFAQTPLVEVFHLAWQVPIIGVIAYSIPLIAGAYIAKRGLKESRTSWTWGGISLLQLAYGSFGAGIIAGTSLSAQATILGITTILTVGITILAATLVYLTNKNFRWAGNYSTYAFIGVFLTALVGSLTPIVLILAFLLAFTGFLLYLIFEIWNMKNHTKTPIENGLGIYIAFAGVFIHVLQIVARNYLEE